MEGYENVFYHVYNRGVDKRVVFEDENDYMRFTNKLLEFNKNNNGESLFVDIICFCLMPNHFHLILRPIVENGITDFMRRVLTGYVMYFNGKYKRKGVLFETSYKSILIENEEYLKHLSRYIHLNPKEIAKSNNFVLKKMSSSEILKKYKWSSYLDYVGIDNFPDHTERKLLLDIFGKRENYETFVNEWKPDDINELIQTEY
ncbi:MAG: transposase [Patescibacteria group bacterium]|nr:transposase [Patescibacteria group bacterium]